jgi:DNA-binding beta-propeller fold protein YncE
MTRLLKKGVVWGLLAIFLATCRSAETAIEIIPTMTVKPAATATIMPESTTPPTIEAGGEESQVAPLTRESPLDITEPAAAEDAMNTIKEATVYTLVSELPSATGGLAVDAAGYIYAANIGLAPGRNGREIYRIPPDGTYELWLEGQGLQGVSGNTFDNQGNLFQSSLRANIIHRIAPDGTVTEFVREGLRSPVGIAIDPEGTLFVANCGNNTIQRVTATGESELFSDSPLLSCPNGITLDGAGNVYVSNFRGGHVVKITPDGEAAELATVPGGNNGHIFFLDGLLYVAARGANQIYTLTLDGELTLLAGTGEAGHEDGPGLQATFSLPNDVVASPDGRRLYINEAFPTDGTTNSPSVIRVIELPRDE